VADDDARINRFLASAGFGSRRAVEALVAQRRVSVNGVIIETLGVRVKATDVVRVNGRPIEPEAPIHVLLHKPAGVVTTAHDPQGRPTVVGLVRIPQRLFPVGRLDANTTGALVLTNDGALANRLMHPRYGVEKVYHAQISRIPTPRGLTALANGVMLDDGPTAPAQVSLVRRAPPVVELVLHEGRNRQVRRMIESIGHSVVALHRPTYGGIGLGGLAPGAWRFLSPAEIETLRKSTSTPGPTPRKISGSRARTSA
jgi:pseudouridine synthase